LRNDAFAVRGGREFDACAHFVSFVLRLRRRFDYLRIVRLLDEGWW
jgi:hypothetical protein